MTELACHCETNPPPVVTSTVFGVRPVWTARPSGTNTLEATVVNTPETRTLQTADPCGVATPPCVVQGYLALRKRPPPQDHQEGGALSYEPGALSPKGSTAFLQNQSRCPPMLGVRRTSRTWRTPKWRVAAYVPAKCRPYTSLCWCISSVRKAAGARGRPRKDPTVGLCRGPYGGARWGAGSYERGTPVGATPLIPTLVSGPQTPFLSLNAQDDGRGQNLFIFTTPTRNALMLKRGAFRGTSPIRRRPPPWDPPWTQGIGLL